MSEPNYLLLPAHLRGGMRRYIECGMLPGDFLRAVIQNDLAMAIMRADEISLAAMPAISRFLFEMPDAAWGSSDKMFAWAKTRADPTAGQTG